MILKKLLLTLVLFQTLNAEFLQYNLRDFIIDTLSSNGLEFVIDENIDLDITVSVDSKVNKIFMLRTILKKHNIYLKKVNNFYYISKIDTDIINRFLKLKFLSFQDIKEYLTLFKNIEYKYLSDTNNLVILSDKKTFDIIKKDINILDILPLQKQIKITVIETNLNKLKDYSGALNLKFGSTNALSVLFGTSFTFDSSPNYTNNDIKSIISFLDSNSISKIITDTKINISHKQTTIINSSQNIPFLIENKEIIDNKTQVNNTYSYKDIGLLLSLKPLIYNDITSLNINFEYSQLLFNNADKPSTTKKSFNQVFNFTNDKKTYILAGLNNFSKVKINKSVPYFSKIPILGYFFKSKNNEDIFTTTTILLSIIDKKDTTYKYKLDKSLRKEKYKYYLEY